MNADVGIGAPDDLSHVRRFSHEAMATVFEVYAVHPDAEYAAQAAQAAFDLTDRLERELSRFIANSDITRISYLSGGASTRVAPSTLECLVIARHMFELTGGAFDISIGTGLMSLDLDIDTSTVSATKDGVRLDLGGIGKGYAVDLMAEVLEEWGLEQALVHGGFSSMLALEPPAGRKSWPLTISDPGDASRVLTRVSARQTALGASGIRKTDHIVDPRTSEPVRARLASWVVVPRPRPTSGGAGPRLAAAAVADALTTAFMMLNREEIASLCERAPGTEAWVLERDAAGEANLFHIGVPEDDGLGILADRDPTAGRH